MCPFLSWEINKIFYDHEVRFSLFVRGLQHLISTVLQNYYLQNFITYYTHTLANPNSHFHGTVVYKKSL